MSVQGHSRRRFSHVGQLPPRNQTSLTFHEPLKNSLSKVAVRTRVTLARRSDRQSGVPTCEETRRVNQRRRQASYEARRRVGVALYPTPLGAAEIEALVALGWLEEGCVTDRRWVGLAVAAVVREIARARR